MPCSSEFADALGGRDQASLEECLEEVDRRRSIGGALAVETQSIKQLVNSQLWECDEVTLPLSSHRELAGAVNLVGRHSRS